MKLKVEEVLNRKGISIAELARRVNVSRSSMHNTIKNGNPNLETLGKIADALDVDVVDLFEANRGDFIALIDYNGQLYRFDNIEALKGFITKPKPSNRLLNE